MAAIVAWATRYLVAGRFEVPVYQFIFGRADFCLGHFPLPIHLFNNLQKTVLSLLLHLFVYPSLGPRSVISCTSLIFATTFGYASR